MVGSTLIEIRGELGFRSARGFYLDHLQKRARLDFNYSYYMKIESEKIIPSSRILSTLASTLNESDSDRLIVSYCQSLFPEKQKLFRKLAKVESEPPRKIEDSPQNKTLLTQRELTPAQIATIAKSQEHYSLFLILTLARGPISVKKLETSIGSKKIESVLEDLETAQLILTNESGVSSISQEMKFPPAQNDHQRRIYSQIDRWNEDFNKVMNFDTRIQKMLLRRVSSRYLSVIKAQSDVLLDLIRASDEIDNDFNEEVVMFTLSLHQGRLPG